MMVVDLARQTGIWVRQMCDDEPHKGQLATRLLLHAGALSEEFSDLAARSRPSRSRLLELAASIGLLTEAAVELTSDEG